MDALTRHAKAEKDLSEHKKTSRTHFVMKMVGSVCAVEDARNEAYEAYTGNPHPSTLGRGGSR